MLYFGAKKSVLSSSKTLAQQVAAQFAAGEQGAWYDPSDFSTLFQDSTGTSPVTAVGQPVGKMLDKSGRGNHATQSTAINRPVLQQDGAGLYYLAFNGTNSWMSVANIPFTTSYIFVSLGVRKLSDSQAIVVESGLNGVGNTSGTFGILSNAGALFAVRGTTTVTVQSTSFASPASKILTLIDSISDRLLQSRINGVDASQSIADQGTGTFSASPLYIGSRGGSSLFLSGGLYGAVIRGAQSSNSQIIATERFVNVKMGAF